MKCNTLLRSGCANVLYIKIQAADEQASDRRLCCSRAAEEAKHMSALHICLPTRIPHGRVARLQIGEWGDLDTRTIKAPTKQVMIIGFDQFSNQRAGIWIRLQQRILNSQSDTAECPLIPVSHGFAAVEL